MRLAMPVLPAGDGDERRPCATGYASAVLLVKRPDRQSVNKGKAGILLRGWVGNVESSRRPFPVNCSLAKSAFDGI